MATLKLVPRLFVAVCACHNPHRHITAAEWAALPIRGLQERPDDSPLEMRNCVCGSTLAVPLDPEQPSPEVERLTVQLEHARHELDKARRARAAAEDERDRKASALRAIQKKARAANQPPPTPPGVEVRVNLDPADPAVRVGKVGGAS